MNKPLHHFFTEDHHRIETLLNKATPATGEINLEYYLLFRAALLRHIKMEETILFPAVKKVSADTMQHTIAKFRTEHGALTSLMVPTPTLTLIKVVKQVLQQHDFEEEKPGGLYDVCEALTKNETENLLQLLKQTPEIPLNPLNPSANALETAKRSLLRAGYHYDEMA